MFTIQELVFPDTVAEAYELLVSKRNNRVLGGCAFFRLGSKRIHTALDLSRLGLNNIKEQDGWIEIGAMVTFRDLEVNPLTSRPFNGAIAKAVSNIIGVQFRNLVTVGASVFAKYGFSDLITVLLALGAEVELYKAGRMPLADFLERPRERDILTRVLIRDSSGRAAYQNLRKSASDFPLINVAVAEADGQWAVAVGARPKKAAIAANASRALSDGLRDLDAVAALVTDELSFGTNARGTARYRKAICQVLVKRAVAEVLQCR